MYASEFYDAYDVLLVVDRLDGCLTVRDVPATIDLSQFYDVWERHIRHFSVISYDLC